jgi:AcrR family transcriptional regulator
MAKRKAQESPAVGGEAWVAAGLRALAAGGIEAVRVEVLARQLGLTKGSFYWHFADRRALLDAMLARWEAASTTDVISEVDGHGGSPAERLARLISLCFRGGGVDRLESALRRWGSIDDAIPPVLARIDEARISYVAALLTEHGLPGAIARDRARLLYLAIIGEFTWTSHGGAPTSRRALEQLGQILLSPEPARR